MVVLRRRRIPIVMTASITLPSGREVVVAKDVETEIVIEPRPRNLRAEVLALFREAQKGFGFT